MKKLMALVLAVLMALSVASFAAAEGEVVKLRWACGTGATAPIDNAMVVEELNKMSREKIGVEMEYQYFTDEQLSLSIQSGEVYDIYFTCSWYNLTNQRISEGLFADISGEIEKYPGLYNALSKEVWDLAHSADGGLYAIPNKKDYAIINYITYPTEKAAELGYEFGESISAWDELTDFLVDWKATIPENEYPVLIGGSGRGMESSFDFIDRTALIGCLFGTTEVVTVFEDPAVMERYLTLAKWFDLGLINPDAAQITETAIDTSKVRIDFVQAWPGYDYSVSNGYPTSMVRYCGPQINVDGIQGSMNALSVTLEEDPVKMDAALKYFELIFTDQLFRDTLRFGVQGYHWNYVTEEQNADIAGKTVLRTQVGNDNYGPWAFAQPAYFETSFSVSEEQVAGTAAAPVLNQYELYFDLIAKEAATSAMGGFTWDSSEFTQQLAEIAAIKDEYYTTFASGTISIEECYDEFMEKMNAAGLQDMIDDAQAQLDAYLGK